MSEGIRKLVRKLNKSVLGILNPTRCQTQLPVSATLEINQPTGNLRKAQKPLIIEGFTQDLSKNGVAFVVPFIRLGEYYFVGSEQRLMLEIQLPENKVKMNVTAQRYEILGEHDSVSSYLVGAKIISMSPENRLIWEDYLKNDAKNKKKKGKSETPGDLQPDENGGSVLGL